MIKKRDIVIIGCGAGGGTAAQFARKTDRKASITILEEGSYSQYSKCGLPYVLSGDILKLEDLIEFSEEWFKKNQIELIFRTKVEAIDTKKQIVIYQDNGTQLEKPYGSLIIATGAKPFIPQIKNLQKNKNLLKGVHCLRTIEDARQIASFVIKGGKVTIIGAGLIGLEIANSLYNKGMKVTVIEMLPSILGEVLDQDMADIVLERINEFITVLTNHTIVRVGDEKGKIAHVYMMQSDSRTEKKLISDLLIIASGTRPNVLVAKKAGCKIGVTGGVLVNNKCETTIKNIFAAGDCTEYKDFITKKPTLIGLGSIAVRQGIAAGVNAAGGNYELPSGVLQTRTSELFNLELAAVGPTSECIITTSVVSGKFKGSTRPIYYPNGKPITVKVSVDKVTGRILNAQAVGNNAAQRINTFACAVLNKMTIEEFKNLETAYAPPIAPTLDAITLACTAASHKMERRSR